MTCELLDWGQSPSVSWLPAASGRAPGRPDEAPVSRWFDHHDPRYPELRVIEAGRP